jgi:hypothetical protein
MILGTSQKGWVVACYFRTLFFILILGTVGDVDDALHIHTMYLSNLEIRKQRLARFGYEQSEQNQEVIDSSFYIFVNVGKYEWNNAAIHAEQSYDATIPTRKTTLLLNLRKWRGIGRPQPLAIESVNEPVAQFCGTDQYMI